MIARGLLTMVPPLRAQCVIMQVVTTLAAVAYVCMAFSSTSGPAAIVLGGGLALSSTAVAMQVLQDRNETGSRHGRAAFAVLLLQVFVHIRIATIAVLARHCLGTSAYRHSQDLVDLAAPSPAAIWSHFVASFQMHSLN